MAGWTPPTARAPGQNRRHHSCGGSGWRLMRQKVRRTYRTEGLAAGAPSGWFWGCVPAALGSTRELQPEEASCPEPNPSGLQVFQNILKGV